MINLCINSFHDASITLMEDGKVIAHLLEERHKNMKHATDPLLALTKIRDYVDRIDLVSFSHLFPEHYSPQIYLTYLKHLLLQHGVLYHYVQHPINRCRKYHSE